jgi:hypothetical protein
MQLTQISKYPSVDWVRKSDLVNELELEHPYPQDLVSQTLPAGTRILVAMSGWDTGAKLERQSEIILDKETKILCEGFGVGLTSDHWLILDDGDPDQVIIIPGEPRQTTKQTRKKYGEDYKWEKDLDSYQAIFLLS